ncbi:hypothetical protein MKW98_005259 [Papaver atlanticum]|uniref:Uncharacterized protein n=1 Tax=Papaver atlanticum TaxID=357466 RepID=A0AAD4RX05_9MAGN|nr:hypothetical protein MKW98_005259 [Papaver atlanticum]
MTLMKAPCIEELEEQMQKLDVDRSIAVLERKASDNADEMIEIETHLSAEVEEFSRGGTTAAVIDAEQQAGKQGLVGDGDMVSSVGRDILKHAAHSDEVFSQNRDVSATSCYLKHSLPFVYGSLPAHGGVFNRDDADANFVPGLVEKVALPLLHLRDHNVPAASVLLRLHSLLSAIHCTDAVANLTVPTRGRVVCLFASEYDVDESSLYKGT